MGDTTPSNPLYETEDGEGESSGTSAPVPQQENRKCRDVLFLLLFFFFSVGMIIIAGYGYNHGDPIVLIYGPDYNGNICNQNANGLDLKGFKHRYFLNPNEVIAAESITVTLEDAASICLKGCPNALPEGNLTWICKYPQDRWGVNVKAHPNMTIEEWHNRSYDYFDLLDEEEQRTSFLLKGPCYPSLGYTRSIFHTCEFRTISREPSVNEVDDFKVCVEQCQALNSTAEYVRCVKYACESQSLLGSSQQRAHSVDLAAYTEFRRLAEARNLSHSRVPDPALLDSTDSAVSRAVDKLLSKPASVMQRYFGDLEQVWPVVLLCGTVAPCIGSFLFILCMRVCAGVLVWTTVLAVNILSIVAALVLYVKAGVIGRDAVSHVPGWDDDFDEALNIRSPPPPVFEYEGGELTVMDSGSNVDVQARRGMLALAVIATVVSLLLLVFSIAMLKKLRICVAVLKVAMGVVRKVPMVLFYPVVPFLGMVAFSAFWLTAAVFVYSSGDVTPRDCR